METSLLPADVGAALELLERTYAWEENGLASEKNHSLETLTVRAVQLTSGLQRAWRVCTREGSVWETGYYLSRVRAVEFLALNLVELLMRTGDLIARTRQKQPDWAVPAAAAEVGPQLAAAREVAVKARELVQWLNREPPPANQEMLWSSQASLDRGEGEAIGELVSRLERGEPAVKE